MWMWMDMTTMVPFGARIGWLQYLKTVLELVCLCFFNLQLWSFPPATAVKFNQICGLTSKEMCKNGVQAILLFPGLLFCIGTFCLLTLTALWAVAFAFVPDWYGIRYREIVVCAGLLLTPSSLLVAIFVPKVTIWYNWIGLQ